MELLTRQNFENWMQKVLERLDRQDELLLSMKAKEKEPSLSESVRLFDNQDQGIGKEDLLQRGGRAEFPFRTRKGFPKRRCRVLQGSYP